MLLLTCFAFFIVSILGPSQNVMSASVMWQTCTEANVKTLSQNDVSLSLCVETAFSKCMQ